MGRREMRFAGCRVPYFSFIQFFRDQPNLCFKQHTHINIYLEEFVRNRFWSLRNLLNIFVAKTERICKEEEEAHHQTTKEAERR